MDSFCGLRSLKRLKTRLNLFYLFTCLFKLNPYLCPIVLHINFKFMKPSEKILKTKGQFVGVTFQTQKTPAASFKGTELLKLVKGTFRAGINFANLGSVKEGIANGERNEVGQLPWGEWITFPYVISHKGETYIRLYPVISENQKVTSEYFVNSKQVSKETFASYLTPSEAKKLLEPDKVADCFSIKENNIISMSGV